VGRREGTGDAGVAAPNDGSYATRGEQYRDWLRYLLHSLSELNGAAGNHARSYFQMAPASIVIRVTNRLVSGYGLYGFQSDGSFPEVVDGILHGDYPGSEFLFGGRLVRVLSEGDRKALEERGAALYRTSSEALDRVAQRVTGRGFLAVAGGAA